VNCPAHKIGHVPYQRKNVLARVFAAKTSSAETGYDARLMTYAGLKTTLPHPDERLLAVQSPIGGRYANLYCSVEVDPARIKDVKQMPSRLDGTRKGFQAARVTMKDFYLVTGQHGCDCGSPGRHDAGEGDADGSIAG
jgi:hypothetical protein